MTEQNNGDGRGWNTGWEDSLYGRGRHLNRYPFEIVIRELLSAFPEPKDCHLLEVGSGAGNNLWFAAREGFSVSGIEGSATAVNFAIERFRSEGLEGDLRVGDFGQLPWASESFDAVLDRKSVTHNRLAHVERVLAEIIRVLKPGGLLIAELYSSAHPERLRGRPLGDGSADRFPPDSYFADVGLTMFFDETGIRDLLRPSFNLMKLEHIAIDRHEPGKGPRSAYWQLTARRR